MSELKTPLRYPGGKTRAAAMLVDNMPSFSEYREPFVGGGSVFIKAKQTKPEAKYWINDIYYDLFSFWREIKENKDNVLTLIRELKERYKNGKELYKYLIDNRHLFSEKEIGAAFFVLNRITFSGTSWSGGFSQSAFEGRFTDSSIKRAEEISILLQNTKITNLDYTDLLRAEGDDVFIFLDPPYYSAAKSALYGNNGDLHKWFDHEKFAEEVKKCKHKWMITYDDSEYIKKMFKGYTILPFELMYGMKNVVKNAEMTGKEILIKNF